MEVEIKVLGISDKVTCYSRMPAKQIDKGLYLLLDDGREIYDDEEWEFYAGDVVTVKQRIWDGHKVLIADKKV